MGDNISNLVLYILFNINIKEGGRILYKYIFSLVEK